MNVKSVLLATAASSLLASSAFAADLSVKAPYRAVAPAAWSWAGLYIGVNIGAAAKYTQAEVINTAPFSTLHTATMSDTGFIGGGQIGYNWQSGNFVWGVEADISGLSGTASDFIGATGGNYTASSEISWLATFRGRAGLVVSDTLLYVTAGLAVAEIKDRINYGTSAEHSETRSGPVGGVGVEHMFAPQWIGRLEVLWADLGKTSSTTVLGAGLTGTKATSFKHQLAIVRAGLNYKF